MKRLFAAIDRLDSQWLATWVLSAIVATFVLWIVLSAATAPLVERTKTTLVDLQLSGLPPWLADRLTDAGGTREILHRWQGEGVLGAARRGQAIDFAFPVAYGFFFLGLAVALWRVHPDHPHGGRWVWGIALGALAALLDEGENAFLWRMLMRPDDDPGRLVPALASALAIGKYALLVAVVPILYFAIRRARAWAAEFESAGMSGPTVSARVDRVMASLSEFMRMVIDVESLLARSEDVCDFGAGTPHELAARSYVDALKRGAEPKSSDWFGYKGAHRPAQEAAAAGLRAELGIEFLAEDILLTRGAHGALAAALGAVVDAGDEVIYVSPPWFFYEAMILWTGATPIKTRLTPPAFDLDPEAIAAAITPRTRMVLLNTPHNPTGRIFSAGSLESLGAILDAASERNGRPIYLLSDQAYSRILFDGNVMVTPARFYSRSVLVHTYSKSSLAPGQRLGYLALPPDMPAKAQLRRAVTAAGLASGNALPDAVMQYALGDIDHMSIDLAGLQTKRDRMVAALRSYGYALHVPEATFYLLVRSPIDDDAEFARRLRQDKVLVLPGRTVDLPGFFRISLTATDAMIDRALPVFAAAMRDARRPAAS